MISEFRKGQKTVSSRLWGKEVLGGGLRCPSDGSSQDAVKAHVLHRHVSGLHSLRAQMSAACSQTKRNHSFNASVQPELCHN